MTDVTGAAGSSTDGAAVGLVKAPTGIDGFDEITYGGMRRGRATLGTGGAGDDPDRWTLR